LTSSHALINMEAASTVGFAVASSCDSIMSDSAPSIFLCRLSGWRYPLFRRGDSA